MDPIIDMTVWNGFISQILINCLASICYTTITTARHHHHHRQTPPSPPPDTTIATARHHHRHRQQQHQKRKSNNKIENHNININTKHREHPNLPFNPIVWYQGLKWQRVVHGLHGRLHAWHHCLCLDSTCRATGGWAESRGYDNGDHRVPWRQVKRLKRWWDPDPYPETETTFGNATWTLMVTVGRCFEFLFCGPNPCSRGYYV